MDSFGTSQIHIVTHLKRQWTLLIIVDNARAEISHAGYITGSRKVNMTLHLWVKHPLFFFYKQ
jgi:hypothetical protein